MTTEEISNKHLLAEITKGNNDLKAALQAVEVKLALKIEEINRRLINVEKENSELKKRIEVLERNQKKNGIIIFGWERQEQFITTKHIIELLESHLKIHLTDSDFNNIYPLGQSYNSPVKVEFVSFLKKTTILKNRKYLKGSSINIDNDLTVQERKDNKILRKHLMIARQDKANNCFIRNNKLHLNTNIFSAVDLENQENTSLTEYNPKPRSDPGTPAREHAFYPENLPETSIILPPAEIKNSVPEKKTGLKIYPFRIPHRKEEQQIRILGTTFGINLTPEKIRSNNNLLETINIY